MSQVSRTQLKTYFVSGATPTEAQFGDFIDSAVNVSEDITDSQQIEDSAKVFSAAGAKLLRDLVDGIDDRVILLENVGPTEAPHNYYNKQEVDAKDSSIAQTINNLPYATQIANLNNVTDNLTVEVGSKADASHGHAISEITNLTDELNSRLTSAVFTSEKADLITAINSKVSAGHTHVMADITDLADFDLSLYAKLTDLAGKADSSHGHLVQDITDINTVYYNKTEIDGKIAEVSGTHTHLESDITDLDKYTQEQTNLRIQDHGRLTNNPHSVTKSQLNLGNVENLSSIDLFSSTASSSYKSGIMTSVQALIDEQKVSLGNHAAAINNPHSVTKAQVGLSSVPNVDVKALFDAHLLESNPHDINLSYFDVYSKAETDERVTIGLDSIRYAFKPTSATDGAGSVGDLTWGSDDAGNYKAYLKIAETAWRAINLFPENSNGDVIFNHLARFEDSINVTENATIGGDLTVTGVSKLGNISINGSDISATLGKMTLSSTATDKNVEVADNLDVTGGLNVTGTANIASVNLSGSTITTIPVSGTTLPGLTITPDVEITGNLTVQGTQTILNTSTLDVEDNQITLNKNVTADPTTNSGIVVERGTSQNVKLFWDEAADAWKLDIGGTIKTIAFNEDLSTHTGRTNNPHQVTKSQVGLGNCDNTSDVNKPVSIAQAAVIAKKVEVSIYNSKMQALDNAITGLENSISSLGNDAYSET